jgi:hypothetical protein
LTRGEQFVQSLPRKTRFYDRNERRSYALTCAVAARLIDDPALVRNGLVHAQRHMAADRRQTDYFAMWQRLLQRDVQEIVRSLLEDTSHGALLRDSQPVFVVLPDDVRTQIIVAERNGAVAASA